MRAWLTPERTDDSLSQDEGAEEVHDDRIVSEADVEDVGGEHFRSDTLDDSVEGVSDFGDRLSGCWFRCPLVFEAVNKIGREVVEIFLLNDEEEDSHANW